MRDNIKIIGVLTFVCFLCALTLSLVARAAKDRIAFNEKKAVEGAIFNIVPGCKNIKEIRVGKDVLYKIINKKGELIGYGFLSQGQGYQGKIKIMTVINPSFKKLLGIEIIDSQETPGLGARINEHFFKDQFKGLNIAVPIEWTKTKPAKNNEIKAITGATISSKSVVNILNKTIDELRSEVAE